MRSSYLLAALLLTTTLLAQDRDFSKVEVKAQKVAGTVYMLTGAGGNIGVSVGEDGIVIVDDQFAPLAPKIKEALRGITDKPIKFILNTHHHGDHTGGNEVFGHDGPIIAQTNVRKRLEAGTKIPGRETPPAPKGALPVLTFDENVSLWINGEEVRAVHYPHGHTDGDSVIFFTKSNVVHMGDDFFNGMYPFVDVDSGGSVKGLIANVKSVLAAIPDDAKVIPGHGALSDRAGLREFYNVLSGTWNAVDAGRKAGKTLEQLKSENVLAQWDSWGKGFIKTDKWIEVLYSETAK
jgi:cyclase